jgi:hypothetical protein
VPAACRRPRPWPGGQVVGPASSEPRGAKILVPASCILSPETGSAAAMSGAARRAHPRSRPSVPVSAQITEPGSNHVSCREFADVGAQHALIALITRSRGIIRMTCGRSLVDLMDDARGRFGASRQRPGIREIRIRYGSGRFWNLKSRRFGRCHGLQGRYSYTRTLTSSFWTCPWPRRRLCPATAVIEAYAKPCCLGPSGSA